MTLDYRASVQKENTEVAQFEFRKSYDTSGLAWGCGLTFWFYGGICWGYVAKPFASDQAMIRNDVRMELAALNIGGYEILQESIRRINWNSELTQRNISFTATAKPTITPEDFEKTIIEKPRAGAPSAKKSEFPSGWPEKWFYETQDYKYWTIVGDRAANSTDAMMNSKKKADQVIATEFPGAKVIQYETTHNDIKSVDGRFESWRIIRVRQSDIR